MRPWITFAISLLAAACTQTKVFEQEAVEAGGCRFVKLEAERLPDLNQPRGGHVTAYLNGELTVLGGHTDGFKMLQTAEYFKDGRWVEVPMLYPHDFGFAVKLPDGKLMLGGGTAENFGIGQSWGVEVYDPENHSFKPVGVLERKRTGASALAFPDGRVLVSGNWYANDDMEIYEPGKGFSFADSASRKRNCPYILQTDSSQAIIFSSFSNRADTLDGCVDRLYGEPFHVPLLDEWIAAASPALFDLSSFSIGNYTYLIPAKRKTDGQERILKVSGEQFSFLDMEEPLPMTGVSGDRLIWGARLKIDHDTRTAYITGNDLNKNFYIAEVNYDATLDGGKASLKLYFSDAMKEMFALDDSWILMEGGKIVQAGGTLISHTEPSASTNFENSREVFIFNTKPAVVESGISRWMIAAFIVAGLALIALIIGLLRKKPEETDSDTIQTSRKNDPKLEEQISKLIEEKELFRNKDIRISDIASELATNRTYISLIINSTLGTNFSDLINGYRIEHAKKLMKERPEMSHTDIAEESGFSSRTSFLRTFKAKTGMTPTEWKESNRPSF